mmetsp:Transcript_114547/g.227952  ORF Transcript_114547/g.227952 Transcript_114547/m.227952 type:complete len:492 (-) Transcript_114547:109-1584(-)
MKIWVVRSRQRRQVALQIRASQSSHRFLLMRSKTSHTEMKVSMAIPVVSLLYAAATATVQVGSGSSGSKGSVLTHRRISPKLDPKSDQVFFRSDYPSDSDASDHEPPAFTYPYPALQDNNNYDADYVKDENGDDGEWKTQMIYDLLRSKIVKRREYMQHKQQTKEKIFRELEEARKRHADAKEAAAKSKKDLDSSINGYGKAKDRYRKLAAGGGSNRDSSTSKLSADIQAAIENVKREMRHLEKCRKELEVARSNLKKLLAAPTTHSAAAPASAPPPGLAPGFAPAPAVPLAASPTGAVAAAPAGPASSPFASPAHAPAPSTSMKAKKAHQAKKEVDDELSRLEKKSATADATAAETMAQAAEAKQEAAKSSREADEEMEKHRIFELEKQEEARKLNQDEHELAEAAARLRRFRQAEDPDGGVHWQDGAGKKAGNKNQLSNGARDSPNFPQQIYRSSNPDKHKTRRSAAAPHEATFLFGTGCLLSAIIFNS